MAESRPKNYPKLENYKPSRFMLPTCHYDAAKADRAVTFIENLRHTKGKWAGKRFWLLPWQEQIIRDVFGIVDERGSRQFRTAYVEIGKKIDELWEGTLQDEWKPIMSRSEKVLLALFLHRIDPQEGGRAGERKRPSCRSQPPSVPLFPASPAQCGEEAREECSGCGSCRLRDYHGDLDYRSRSC